MSKSVYSEKSTLTHDISLCDVKFCIISFFINFVFLATMYLYDTIFNYTLYWHISKSIKKKVKRPNLYNKKILKFRHSDSLRFSLFVSSHIFHYNDDEKEKSVTHSDLITFDS